MTGSPLSINEPDGQTEGCRPSRGLMSKVPAVTFAFWLIKICATTLGETGGDALSMTLGLGFAMSTAIFFGIFLVAVTAQIRAGTYHRFLY